MALFKKLGHREGYAEGYRDGYGEGIDKAFGIDDEEAGDIEDRALEMELDERLIKKWDEMKTPNM